MSTLRPAEQLRLEAAARAVARERSDHESAMADAVRLIEQAHREGRTECSYLTFPETVVEELRARGYRVTYQKACGMGDVDSHRIQWSKS